MIGADGLQNYATADGRRLRLPPGIAANFTGALVPVDDQPPEPLMQPGDVQPPPAPPAPSVDASAMQSAPVMPPPPEPEPAPAATPPPVQTAPPPVQTAPPAVQTAPPATALAPLAPAPAPRHVTDADLLRSGQSGVLSDQNAAIAAQESAIKQSAAAEADALTAQGDAVAARNLEVDRILVERQKAAEEKVRRIEAVTIDADKAAQAYADHKISREVAHPIMAGIGLLLGAVGSAMDGKGGENPALTALISQMDKSVQLQMAERDKLKDVAAQKRGAIDRVRQVSDDKIATYNLAMAGEMERAARQIDEISKRSAVPTVQANAAQSSAVLREKAAGYKAQAVDRVTSREDQRLAREQQAKQQAQSIGVQYAQMAQADRHFNANLQLAREKEANDREIALAKSGGKNSEAYQKLSKETEERGVRDPTTGDYLLNAQGKRMVAEAERLDAEAKSLRSKGGGALGGARELRARQAEERAAILRDEARTVHAIRGRSPPESAKADTEIRTAQRMLSLIDSIKNKAGRSGTKILNQDELQAALETEMSVLGLEIKDLYTLGSLDEGASKYMKKIIGDDPSKLTTAGFLGAIGVGAESAEKTSARLDALAKSVDARGQGALTSLGVKPGEFKFQRNDESARPEYKATVALRDAKTPLEAARGEVRGSVGKAVMEESPPALAGRMLRSAFTGDSRSRSEVRSEAAINRVSRKYPGLSPEQEGPIDALLAQAGIAGAEGDRARATIREIASDTTRPDLSNAVLNVLRDSAPGLYREAVGALPEEDREVREAQMRADAKIASQQRDDVKTLTADTLGSLAVNDLAARTELFRRFTSGDPEARATWVKVLPRLQRKGPL